MLLCHTKGKHKALTGKWMNLKTIILNEVNQTHKFEHHIVFPYEKLIRKPKEDLKVTVF